MGRFNVPRPWSMVGVLAASSCLGSAPAGAGGFYSPYQSGTAIASALAGASARADDPSFFFFNPAIASSFDKTQTFSDVRVFIPTARIKPTRATSPTGDDITASGASSDLTQSAIAPGSFSVLPLGNGLTLGVGSSAHFATDVETTPQWAGRFHLLSSRMVGMNAVGAVSWQATPWLAMAGGVQVQRIETKFTSAALIPQAGGPAIETTAYLKGNDWAAGVVAGLVITPDPSTRIGLSWRSALTHDIDGKAGAALAGIPVEKVRYDVNLPQTVSLGLEHRLNPDIRLFGELQWVDWSRFKGFEISFATGRPTELRPIAWEDTWLAAAGFGYRLAPGTELITGISYDTAASPDGSGTTLSPDAGKIMLGLGVTHDLPGWGRVSVNYAHVFVEEAPVRASNPAGGTLEGTLDASLEMFAASYVYAW